MRTRLPSLTGWQRCVFACGIYIKCIKLLRETFTFCLPYTCEAGALHVAQPLAHTYTYASVCVCAYVYLHKHNCRFACEWEISEQRDTLLENKSVGHLRDQIIMHIKYLMPTYL